MSKALVVANWKMNPGTMGEARKLFETARKAAERSKNVSVIIAPPAIFLRDLTKSYRGRAVAFAVQNAHYDASGAHTGDISMAQARDSKATYVIVGHAERRALGETNDETNKKVKAALASKLTPILCVGETARSVGGEHFELVREQLRIALSEVPAQSLTRVIIVYEPLWTIGADNTMNPRDMHEMAIFIRKSIVDAYGPQGHAMKILYGGSVDAKNARAMLEGGDVRGFLVGRASADGIQFTELIKAISI